MKRLIIIIPIITILVLFVSCHQPDISITPNYQMQGWASEGYHAEYNPYDVAVTICNGKATFEFYRKESINHGYIVVPTGKIIDCARNYDLYLDGEQVFNFWILENGEFAYSVTTYDSK